MEKRETTVVEKIENIVYKYNCFSAVVQTQMQRKNYGLRSRSASRHCSGLSFRLLLRHFFFRGRQIFFFFE